LKGTLTIWQAACIITGYGVGTGIMALPYLVSRAGLVLSAVILLIAFFASYCMHMMLAEITIGGGTDSQIVSVFKQFLFRGSHGNIWVTVLFVLTALVLITNLAAYIAGGAEVIEAFGVPPLAAQLIFYAIAASVVFFGLKVLGISESFSIDAIIVLVVVLAGASLFHLNNDILYPAGDATEALAFFGMAMFAFVAFFSVPQTVVGLNGDPAKVRKAIMMGLGMNLVFIVVIVSCSLAASTQVTEVAIIGWAQGIGLWAQVVGSLFTLLAMLTTYWSISVALSDIVEEQMHWNRRICWLIATLPSLLLVLLNVGGFLSLMRTAGGLIAILISFMVVPAFRRCRREKGALLLPATLASTPVQMAVLAAYLLMAVGSSVSI